MADRHILKIKKVNLSQWLANIAKEYELIAPVKENVIQFKPVGANYNLHMHFSNSVIPPKLFFLPQTEDLFVFHKDKGKLELTPVGVQNFEPLHRGRVIFGIRPCDAKSFELLDCAFSGEFKDSYYIERRKKTILIGLACTQPSDTCFCNSFGIDPLSAKGTDIFLTELDEYYSVDVSTDRGKKLVNLAPDLFPTASKGGRKEIESLKVLKFKSILMDRVYKSEKLKVKSKKFDDGIWFNISQKCIECGICTYLCPTCYCFDVQDKMKVETSRFIGTVQKGVRFRCWDSCMFSNFTLMASGENPRPTKRERIKNRFFHKFKYSKDRYGIFGCVGCGRCITKCPVNIDITKVLEKLANYGE